MNNKAISLILGLSFVAGCIAQANLPVLDSCVICSSRTNITCATDPESHQKFACENAAYLQGCYTRILDGFTIRGCSSDLDEGVLNGCRNGVVPLCTVCSGETNSPIHGCNDRVFPQHRVQCHQCRGAVGETCDAAQTTLPTFCELFEENDRCYVMRTRFSITRGCMSSRGTNCEDPAHCHICEFTGCNRIPGEEAPEAPGSAVTNTISMVLLSTAFIFALAKSS